MAPVPIPIPAPRHRAGERKISFTIYLLMADYVEEFEKVLLSDNQDLLLLDGQLEGVFAPLEHQSEAPPPWVGAVNSLLEEPIPGDLISRSPAGLLVVWRKPRTYVLPFGQGAWQKLKTEWLERDFGRRVALNAIPPDAVVWLRSEQFLAKWHLASEKAPRASSVEEFGVDFERDLVNAVGGSPALKPELGERVTGGTSLRVNLPISSLADVLDICSSLFDSDSYRVNWPDIDNIRRIDDDAAIILLEQNLDQAIANGQPNQLISMFTPFQRRGEAFVAENYVLGKNYPTAGRTPYLTFQHWLDFLMRKNLQPSVDQAKQTPVHILDERDAEKGEFSVFQCFGFESDLNGQVCILSSGQWYEVLADFVARVNRRIGELPRAVATLPPWNRTDSEDAYNLLCARNRDFLLCDRRIFRFGGDGPKYQFEFCDLFNPRTRTLFFVKKGSKSSGMSHLFEQVRRTVEPLFGSDPAYRERIIQLLGQHHPTTDVSWLATRPRQGDWNICMVSLGEPAAALPFFARCALVKLYDELDEQRHAISFVDV
jgi:uncharacterized protein (TIGR04141 family)